jgi:hypothetical protein
VEAVVVVVVVVAGREDYLQDLEASESQAVWVLEEEHHQEIGREGLEEVVGMVAPDSYLEEEVAVFHPSWLQAEQNQVALTSWDQAGRDPEVH